MAVRAHFGGVFVPEGGLKGRAGTLRGCFCARRWSGWPCGNVSEAFLCPHSFPGHTGDDFRERFYVVLGEVVGYFGRGAIK